MLSLKALVDKIINTDIKVLKQQVYLSDIRDEDTSECAGKFSLIYVDDCRDAYGVSFAYNKTLRIFSFSDHTTILECHWNEQNKTWHISSKSEDIPLSVIVPFVRKLKELLTS